MSHFSPIQRLLGLPPGADNPFDLLGLTPGSFAGPSSDEAEQQVVKDALARRLDRLARHPHGIGHEADEVRLALYAAAAQLADARVRTALASQWSEHRAAASFTPDTANNDAVIAFREAALPVFLSAGRLNSSSRRRLVALAHAHGLDVGEVRRALQPGHMAIGMGRIPITPRLNGADAGVGAAASRPSIYGALDRSAIHDAARARRRIRDTIGAIGMMTLLIACALVASIFMRAPLTSDSERLRASADDAEVETTRPPTAADGDTRGEQPDGRRTDAAPSEDVARGMPDERPPDPAALLSELRRLPDMLARRPGDAAWRFEHAVRHFARRWTEFDEPTLVGAVEAIVDFIHRAPAGAESSRRALGVIGAGAKRMAGGDAPLVGADVLESAWSVGVLTRLLRERDLTGSIKYAVDRELAYALGDAVPPDSDASFHAGARAGLRSMIGAIPVLPRDEIDEPAVIEAWETWLDALRSAHASNADEAARERIVLGAVEWLLSDGPSPAREPVARDVMERLLAAVRWRIDASPEVVTLRAPLPAHAEMVAWFEIRAIRTEGLAVVTEWIVRESDAPGVGVSSVLTRAAGAEERSNMRGRYASAWQLDRDPPESGVATRWSREAREESGFVPGRGQILSSLVRAAVLARLNEAAARRWAGEVDEAWSILQNLRDPVTQAAASPRGRGDSVADERSYNDGEWALRFLGSEQSQAGRLEALVVLERRGGGRIGPIDADVLAEAALLAGNDQVRTIAARIVRRHGGQAAMINGVLEALPRAPRRPHVAAVVESLTNRRLPRLRDPEWPAAARRALVERQLELMAGEGEHGVMDRISVLIADAYAGRLSALGAGASTDDPALLADRMWEVWRADADRYGAGHKSLHSLSALERRRAGRSRLATGPVDAFAAAQAGLAEMMGYVIAAERPSRAGAVERALTELLQRRREARHIGAQIEAAEQAMLTLWMIRYGVDIEERTR